MLCYPGQWPGRERSGAAKERAHSIAYRTTTRVRRPEGQRLNNLLGRLFGLVRPASQHSKTSR
jgi:hypothetical protein